METTIKNDINSYLKENKEHLFLNDQEYILVPNKKYIIPNMSKKRFLLSNYKDKTAKTIQEDLNKRLSIENIEFRVPTENQLKEILPQIKKGRSKQFNFKRDNKIYVYNLVNKSIDIKNSGLIIPCYRLNQKEKDNIPKFLEKCGLIIDGFQDCIEKKLKSIEEKQMNLLNSDKNRIDLDSYDEKILTDINRGHWEVEAGSKEFIYRNPKKDVVEDGIVGIDFGTKSTVVAYQKDGDYTLPMRIGIGKLKKEIESYQYENPTVMEFINLNEFLNAYEAQEGRPKTKWNDLTISHTANNSYLNSSSEHYYSYFSDLKRWCGDKGEAIIIKDKKGEKFVFNNFLEIEEGEINPIEIYAYYLGLYINNMYRGIYLDYILSFPVTYEKEVREKILESFNLGLKKSLPKEILEDKELMDSFSVVDGANEPAAYAIVALQEYKLEPEEDKEVFYGVFDFGGGTTDFDFGMWRYADERKERRYDYVIEHFGAGGDKYLGGENLLELLAFEVFKENRNELIKNNITFNKPVYEKEFLGSETLISNSEEAKINMKIVMEKLRPITEKHDGYENLYAKGIISVNLYDNKGLQLTNFSLNIDLDKVEQILKERIEKGVRNFFESLRLVFANEEIACQVDKINIFLAGNSSKSLLVKELFNEYIEKETLEIKKITGIDNIFKLYPALGTSESYKLLEELGVKREDSLEKPTGKTGVAFGLIESRPGGKIKVVNKDLLSEGMDKFKYFVGYSKRKMFKAVLNHESKYGEWIDFIDASESVFELYYTELPEATTGNLSISETKRIKVKLDKTDDEALVYIRPVSTSKIEYVVAMEDEIETENYLTEPITIEI